MTTYDFLKQPIWVNRIFRYKNETLFFENWLNARILYVKEWCIKPLNYFSHILTKKHTCEYLVIKNVFQKHKQQFD